ncbi:WxcM-like domain-containing protein [Candidatus Peregrinibacteria bacterium]|nr:WxcM-like domain-containing protein [Candidatus Peregrinibacteria bacterium]
METVKKKKLPKHSDDRGELTVIELRDFIDWEPKRIYYVTNAVKDRGGHAVVGEKKMYVCMKGSCSARIHDGQNWKTFDLKGPNDALLVNHICFREFFDFSEDAVLMAISNMNYEPDKYIFDL